MLTFLPSKDPSTIAVEMYGKSTEEDARKLDNFVKENLLDGKEFNLLAVIENVDGASLKGLAEGIKFDTKRMNQFNKIAIVADQSWSNMIATLSNLVPGIKAKHFDSDQLDDAWNWILGYKQDSDDPTNVIL
ncbi:STAS/SEC14 domain-containing protein [Pradoshia sp. D12]|uniref:STAS/SEC14 domain-containing protein n=1 Tax=Bacillaceae TaxID=186817 RepID=UPI001126AF72|nr:MULTISPECIES: STAS/SEC14 domain-containing protein [Bacillaceae]QFK72015.1 STAS/SEC14 domain-containing protein [Pradoshia sp. D12]TPF71493.1 STAS/SEC14 domain-containing protein [Bacillus sp. D12]